MTVSKGVRLIALAPILERAARHVMQDYLRDDKEALHGSMYELWQALEQVSGRGDGHQKSSGSGSEHSDSAPLLDDRHFSPRPEPDVCSGVVCIHPGCERHSWNSDKGDPLYCGAHGGMPEYAGDRVEVLGASSGKPLTCVLHSARPDSTSVCDCWVCSAFRAEEQGDPNGPGCWSGLVGHGRCLDPHEIGCECRGTSSDGDCEACWMWGK